MDGEGFGAAYGATSLGLSDHATFGVGTPGAAVATEIDCLMNVPLNTTVIPLFINVVIQNPGTILEGEVLFTYGAAGIIGASSVSVTPHNLRSDDSNTSAITVSTFGDAGGTGHVPTGQIFRKGGFFVTPTVAGPPDLNLEWSVGDKGIAPIIVGAAAPASQISGWSSFQAGIGFHHLQWVEIDSSTIT
jgi:hypothetical protein